MYLSIIEQLIFKILPLVSLLVGIVSIIWRKKMNLPRQKEVLLTILSFGMILLSLISGMKLFFLPRLIDLLLILISSIFSYLVFIWISATNLFYSQKNILKFGSILIVLLNVGYIAVLVYGILTICSKGC
jgi:hypothetical protein